MKSVDWTFKKTIKRDQYKMKMIIDSCCWDIGIYMMPFIIVIMLPLNSVFGGK
jgi:hypothetical protein